MHRELELRIERGELQTTGEVTDYARYRVTESGVSPRALPGVVGVFTGADLAADDIGPLPCGVTNIAMGTEIDNIVEFEEVLDLPLDDAPVSRSDAMQPA